MPGPKDVSELVEKFDSGRQKYLSSEFNETQTRREFIDPLFKALGWNIDNSGPGAVADAYKDVVHEDAIKIGSASKAPDYCFRVGGTRKFFLEAKKPSVDIKDDPEPAYQLRRYAWSAGLPLSVLTDFEELSVYDCRQRPAKSDKPSAYRVAYFTYTEYESRWEELAGIFSREAVWKGSFDKFAQSKKIKKGTAGVDGAFLEEIESWRMYLAKNLALRNPRLSQRELNYSVQQIIDRIVFLRICEDRGIEKSYQLQELQDGEDTYHKLLDIFERADKRYNSGLFHFHNEKDQVSSPDLLTPKLKLDDKVLKDILKHLYYPDSPYEFSVIPADILGHVYERFLGSVISLTPGHHAKIQEKPEVRKAGGVYYTPTYIVDYIIKNTVGTILEGNTPEGAEKLKILDPACGSGSFLIGAYQYLLDWHLSWYVANNPEKWAKDDGRRKEKACIYRGRGGEWRLTTPKKKRILLNNLYGVDIDTQAVEVTKLSLLLKLLERENDENLRLFPERVLPDLSSNVKCGNSLIGPDFYKDIGQRSLPGIPDEGEKYRVNAFDWQSEFHSIITTGGFDAVIGNPPWGAEFSEPELTYLRRAQREVVARMIDSYIYFVSQAVKLTRKEGLVGFIVPSTVLNQVDAKPVRELLLNRGLSALVSLGQGVFGSKVLNTSTIFISVRREASSPFILQHLADLPLAERPNALNLQSSSQWLAWANHVRGDPHLTFFVGQAAPRALLHRLRQEHDSLGKVVRGAIQRGVSPDVAAAHVTSKSQARSIKLEPGLLRPSVSGGQIKRYHPWAVDQFITYTTRDTPLEKYPIVARHLKAFRKLNTCKEVVEGNHPWWALHRPREPEIFTSPKFIGLTTSKRIEVIYDSDASLYVTDAMYVFSLIPDHDPWACMAILHSTPFLFLYRVANQGESRVIPQIKASKLETLPYPARRSSPDVWNDLSQRCKGMLALHRDLAQAKTEHERAILGRQIAANDQQIDRLVYGLYGMTQDEIAAVEAGATQ